MRKKPLAYPMRLPYNTPLERIAEGDRVQVQVQVPGADEEEVAPFHFLCVQVKQKQSSVISHIGTSIVT